MACSVFCLTALPPCIDAVQNPEKLFSMGAMLGLGNQGAVYRATSHKSGMEVALKTCKFQEKDHLMAYLDSLILCESLRTCKLLAVARTFDAFEDSQEGPVYVTVWEEQQLLQGVSLDERLWRTQVRLSRERGQSHFC